MKPRRDPPRPSPDIAALAAVRRLAGTAAMEGGLSAVWGGITGTLSAQADLAAALAAKLDDSQAGTFGLTLLAAVSLAAAKTSLAYTKADVGLGNVDNTSNATERAAVATLTNKTIALGSNTISGTKAQFDAAVTDGNILYTDTLDTDGTLAANSDSKLATQKAVKTYVDQIVAAQDAMVFKGVVDCSANPNYPAADRGHTYRVSVAGKIGGASGVNVEIGDLLLCLTDGTAAGNQATVGTSWSIAQANLDGAVIGPASAADASVAGYSGTSGKLIKQLSAAEVRAAADFTSATSKATPVDADELPLVDSAASNVLKKLTWANLKATLKTYFDTLYQPVGTVQTTSPTPTSGTGTFTSASAAVRYLQIGKLVWVRVKVTITTNGTAATSISVPLPVTPRTGSGTDYQTLACAEHQVAGVTGRAVVLDGVATLQIRKYDNSYLGGDGYVIVAEGWYEAA